MLSAGGPAAPGCLRINLLMALKPAYPGQTWGGGGVQACRCWGALGPPPVLGASLGGTQGPRGQSRDPCQGVRIGVSTEKAQPAPSCMHPEPCFPDYHCALDGRMLPLMDQHRYTVTNASPLSLTSPPSPNALFLSLDATQDPHDIYSLDSQPTQE